MSRDCPLASPVLPMTWDTTADDFTLQGCDECLPWSADVQANDDGTVHVTEWHAIGCPILKVVEEA